MTDAPVWPALKSASARPSRTASAATRIEARGFRRSASAALSDISMRSGASMIWTSIRRNRLATGWRASSASIAAASPDEQQPDLEVPRRDERAIDDDGRPGVTAHGVDRDTHDQLPAVGFSLQLTLEAGAILRPP